jgi:hypothetical protein
VLFDDIPSTYKHLQLRISARDTGITSTMDSVYLRLGDAAHTPVDTGANYERRYMTAEATAVMASTGTNNTEIWFGKIPKGSTRASEYGNLIIDILDYTNTNKFTTLLCVDRTVDYLSFRSGLWEDTSVVNAVQLYNTDYLTGSTVTLYGITG